MRLISKEVCVELDFLHLYTYLLKSDMPSNLMCMLILETKICWERCILD